LLEVIGVGLIATGQYEIAIRCRPGEVAAVCYGSVGRPA
jgi:hypothetical protein